MKSSELFRPLTLLLGIAACLGFLANGITKEVPFGGITGAITMRENGKPLPGVLITLRPIELAKGRDYYDTDDKRSFYRFESNQDGSYKLTGVEAGDYELTASTAAHSVPGTYIHIPEGRPISQPVVAEPVEPFLNVYSSQHVFTPDEQIEFSLNGFGEGESVQIQTFKLRESELLKSGSLYETLSPLGSQYRAATKQPSDIGQAVKSEVREIVTRDLEGVFNERLKLDHLSEGLYWVQAKFGNEVRGTWFSISRIALVTKTAGGKLSVFASDIRSGKPIPDVQLGIGREGQFQALARTNSSGLAAIDQSAAPSKGILMGLYGESRAFVDLRIGARSADRIKAFVYTERPVYRPGDEVNFKGIVRKLTRDSYVMAGNRTVSVDVRDSDDSSIAQFTLPLSAMGTFSGKLRVDRESKPGTFSIRTKVGDQSDIAMFEVAEYRKPEFSIAVEPLKPYYFRGDTAQVEVRCEYFFGGPVRNAEIEATISVAPTWDFGPIEDDGSDYDEEGAWGYGGEYVATIKAKTDNAGRALITFPTAVSDEMADSFGSTDMRYTVDIWAADSSGKYFDGQGTLKVVRGKRAVAVDIDSYVVEPDKPFQARIIAYDPVTLDRLPNTEVVVEAGYNIWKGKTSEFALFAKKTVKTNSKGEAVMDITPYRGGDLEIHADVDGGRGMVRAYGGVWVDKSGDLYSGVPPIESGLTVKLDKKQYAQGSTAKVRIESNAIGASAWITVEAEGVLLSKVVPIEEQLTVVDVPVSREMSPTAYVGVVIVRDKNLLQRSRRLNVDIGSKRLKVSVQSDKPVYHPGDWAEYRVETRLPDGRPVPAEVSLAVVDESIYSIMEDSTNIESAFYPRRYNEVETRYSFEEIYLDGGDKAPKNIQVRRRFKDTAFWMPSVVTGANGQGSVRFQLPDNLTTWRATAIGITSDTSVGQAVSKVRARKELMIRLEAPQFFVQHDEERITALVTNDSGRDAEVHVDIVGTNVSLDGDLKRTIRIKNGATEAIEWKGALPESGEAKFVARAWIGQEFSDGVELIVPVKPHARTYQENFSGVANGTQSVALRIRDGADVNSSRVRVYVSGSLAGSLSSSLEGLIGFPYGCVEQTLSRFIPTVVLTKGMAKMGLPPPSQAARMPQMVAEGMNRLRTMQHADGGWGWWEFDESDEFMTGYVLEGLGLAALNGFAIDQFVLRDGRQFAAKRAAIPLSKVLETELKGIDRAEWRAEAERGLRRDRIQLLYGLALTGGVEAGLLAGVEPSRDDPAAIATMALLCSKAGDSAGTQRWMQALRAQVRESQGMAHWTGSWGSEATARAFQAVMELTPADSIQTKIVRYLLGQRRGGMWMSTRDTSAVLLAMTSYLSKTRELEAKSPITVSLNGRVLATVPATFGISASDFIEIPFGDLSPRGNEITFSRAEGPVYYTVNLRQAVTIESFDPIQSPDGATVQRSYFPIGQTLLEDGRLTTTEGERAIDSAKAGERIKVVLTIKTSRPLEFVIVEDPIPSNCHIEDFGRSLDAEEWSWWWAQTVVRDDRAAFFISSLPAGEHKLTYIVRAENPGKAAALPTVMYNMYDPDRLASASSMMFQVVPK